MAVLDWLQQLLGGGDPEAQGQAAASTAMMPAVNQWAQNVASGNYVRQGLPSNYDPNQSFAQNALNPNSLENALNVALGVGGGSGLGIKAYHGSPYDFNAFDASKIGTGEGAQAYGHGLYFAENEGVARSYRDTLSKGNDPRDWINEIIGALNSPIGKPAPASISGEQLATELQRYPITANLPSNENVFSHILNVANGYEAKSNTYSPSAMRSLQFLDNELPKPPPGKMYEVDINADPQQFLDWDKPLSEQPQAVQKAFGGIIDRDLSQETGWAKLTGEGAHRAVVERAGIPGGGEAALNQAGIPGIRYLDQGSRGAGQGTSNYVVFDPSIIQILRKYGIIPPAVGAGLLGAADQQ